MIGAVHDAEGADDGPASTVDGAAYDGHDRAGPPLLSASSQSRTGRAESRRAAPRGGSLGATRQVSG